MILAYPTSNIANRLRKHQNSVYSHAFEFLFIVVFTPRVRVLFGIAALILESCGTDFMSESFLL